MRLRHAILVFVVCCVSTTAIVAEGTQISKDAPVSRVEAELLVKKDLAGRLKVPVDRLKVVSVSDETWPDANLGCRARKGLIEPASIPGHAFTLTHAGKQYIYHTDRSGRFRRCAK